VVISQDCAIIFRKAKPPKRHISKNEFISLKALKDDLGIVILKDDKGGAVVIRDKLDYSNKMIDHL